MSATLYECPHCHEKQITAYHKLFSVCFSPAICPACHEESNVHIVHGLIMLTVWMVLTWVFIGLSIMAQMSFFLLGTIPAFIFCVNKYILTAPLEAREPQQP